MVVLSLVESRDPYIISVIINNEVCYEHIANRINKIMAKLTVVFIGFAVKELCIVGITQQLARIIDKAASKGRLDILEYMTKYHPKIKGSPQASIKAIHNFKSDVVNYIVYKRKDPLPTTFLLECIRTLCESHHNPEFTRSMLPTLVQDTTNVNEYIRIIISWAEGCMLHGVQRLKPVSFQLLPPIYTAATTIMVESESNPNKNLDIDVDVDEDIMPLDVALMFGDIAILNAIYKVGYKFISGQGLISGYSSSDYLHILKWVHEKEIEIERKKQINVPSFIHAPLFYSAAHMLDVKTMKWLIEVEWNHDIDYHTSAEAIDAPKYHLKNASVSAKKAACKMINQIWRYTE